MLESGSRFVFASRLTGFASRFGLAVVVACNLGASVSTAAAAPREPFGRLLPLTISAPSGSVPARSPRAGIVVRLRNDGAEAPASRLRLTIREKDHVHKSGTEELGPNNVRVEVLERGAWVPVALGIVDGGVIGAIGAEGVGRAGHKERHRKGGMELKAGMDKSWQFRVTFNQAGSYALGASLSPDNGSRHLAQPAYTTIEVRP